MSDDYDYDYDAEAGGLFVLERDQVNPGAEPAIRPEPEEADDALARREQPQ